MKLNIYKSWNSRLFDLPHRELHTELDGPTLFHLEGDDPKPLFISTLLHGNEYSGFEALKIFLKQFENKKPSRSLIIFIGNIKAARKDKRHLDDQPDFNRIWSPDKCGHAEFKLVEQVMDYIKSFELFASVDIHNNTGDNPLYGCVNKIDNRYFNLAGLFHKKIVYFTEPHEVQSMAFSRFCPATTIEAGVPGDPRGIKELVRYLNELMDLKEFPSQLDPDIEVYHTIAKILIRGEMSFNFEQQDELYTEISFVKNFDQMNFKKVKEGAIIAHATGLNIMVVDNEKQDITEHFFEHRDGKILVKRSFIPSMFTQDKDVVIQDCLGYIMEEYQST